MFLFPKRYYSWRLIKWINRSGLYVAKPWPYRWKYLANLRVIKQYDKEYGEKIKWPGL